MFKMELEYKKGILFARLKGILSNKYSYKVNNYLNYCIKKHNIKYLVYNWENLKMIDESGLNAIRRSKYYIKNNKGKIRVYGARDSLDYLRKYLKLKSIDKESDIFKEMTKC